jgi:hypothetical protein
VVNDPIADIEEDNNHPEAESEDIQKYDAIRGKRKVKSGL